MPPGRSMTGAQPASNRFAADAQGPSDAADGHPLLAQAHRFLKAGVSALLGVQRPLFGLGDRQPGILSAGCIKGIGCVKGIVVGGRFGGDGGSDLSRLIEVTMMVIEHTAERITAVAQQMSGSRAPLPKPRPGHRERSPAPGSHRTWRAVFASLHLRCPAPRSSTGGSQHFRCYSFQVRFHGQSDPLFA